MRAAQAQRYVYVSVREGQHGHEVVGFTICLRPGEEWTAAVSSTGPGQARLQVGQPGSCDSTVRDAGLTPPPVAGHTLAIAADLGYVEAYTLESTPSEAAVLWGEATLINPGSGYASSYMATALVGLTAQDERATTANNAAVADALAAASGVEKAILWVQWMAGPQSGVSTHVVLTFPGGHQPGADDPMHLSMPNGEENEPVTLQQMTLPNVVNVCTLAHVGERTTVQCPAVERGEPGAILIGIGAR